MSDGDTLESYSSTGHRFSNASFIDAHYAVCQASYEAMLRAVGIRPGWHVLDAGCGSGGFLPLMAELVGPGGRIAALDQDPDHIERVRALAPKLGAPVEARVGSVTELPYPDDSFDAVWNANVSQYLSDDELAQMLSEFARVVRPGGLVAVKESDETTIQFYPLNQFVFWRWLEQSITLQAGRASAANLPRWLKDAGLVDVRQRSFLEEIRAPLPAHVHTFVAGALRFFAEEAEGFALPESDMAQWRRCREPDDPDNPVNHPDFYFREGMTLVVGAKGAVGAARE